MKHWENWKEKRKKMKSLFEQVNQLDELIRQCHKLESRMRSGQWIDAWREINRIIAYLNKTKEVLIKNSDNNGKL